MHISIAGATLLAWVGVLAAPAWGAVPTAPHTASVTVGPEGSPTYDPAVASVRLGGMATWTWASSGHSVTDTSGLGLFDSGVQSSGATFSYTFFASGNYHYSSTDDASMTGLVKVPIQANRKTGTIQTKFTVTWALALPPPGVDYEVKKRLEGHPWVGVIRSDEMSYQTKLVPGTTDFRARMTGYPEVTAWSPILTIVVTG
jgi:plastocyanin